ncbi:MAG TPA: sulfotransferase [Tepidisphaeraceae bacterium]|jgi:tetratricopeptide (TPR) repeat protein
MSRRDRRKSKTKKMDYSQRVSRLKAKALTDVAKRAWNAGLGYKTVPLLLDALRRDPRNPDILLSLAAACGKQRYYDKAEQYLVRLLELGPRKASIHRRVAEVYVTIDRPQKAIECFHRALELDRDAPETVSTLLSLSRMYERVHQLDNAGALLAEVLQRDPGNAEALLQRAILDRRRGAIVQAESAFRALATDGARNRVIGVQAWYELAQLLDDQSRYDEAYQAFVAAKALLQPHAAPFRRQIEVTLRKNAQLLESLNQATYERWRVAAEQDSPYRFAVLTSHPRSGTTLVEQVLDSHEQVKSADEFDVFAEWINAPIFRRFPPTMAILAVLDRVPSAVRRQARATYFQQTEAIFDEPIGQRLLIDKNPGMTILMPVVNWAFPEMKMLIALRDPRDVLLSCFMQKVPLTPISANWLNLQDAAEYYTRAMQTWLKVRELTPSPWLQFRYEDVVADLEGNARRIVEFLDLPWDQSVLKFHEHARQKLVRSPTYEDVTRPVYQSSVGRWQNYAKQLEPVMEKLAPFVREFGYG